MTTAQVYDLKTRAFQQYSARYKRILASAFPETGGCALYVHNWYRCSPRSPEHSCAEALLSAEWDWWHKIEARLTRWYQQAEHRRHAHQFRAAWCPICRG